MSILRGNHIFKISSTFALNYFNDCEDISACFYTEIEFIVSLYAQKYYLFLNFHKFAQNIYFME
jgi:hypothetical protein